MQNKLGIYYKEENYDQEYHIFIILDQYDNDGTFKKRSLMKPIICEFEDVGVNKMLDEPTLVVAKECLDLGEKSLKNVVLKRMIYEEVPLVVEDEKK